MSTINMAAATWDLMDEKASFDMSVISCFPSLGWNGSGKLQWEVQGYKASDFLVPPTKALPLTTTADDARSFASSVSVPLQVPAAAAVSRATSSGGGSAVGGGGSAGHFTGAAAAAGFFGEGTGDNFVISDDDAPLAAQAAASSSSMSLPILLQGAPRSGEAQALADVVAGELPFSADKDNRDSTYKNSYSQFARSNARSVISTNLLCITPTITPSQLAANVFAPYLSVQNDPATQGLLVEAVGTALKKLKGGEPQPVLDKIAQLVADNTVSSVTFVASILAFTAGRDRVFLDALKQRPSQIAISRRFSFYLLLLCIELVNVTVVQAGPRATQTSASNRRKSDWQLEVGINGGCTLKTLTLCSRTATANNNLAFNLSVLLGRAVRAHVHLPHNSFDCPKWFPYDARSHTWAFGVDHWIDGFSSIMLFTGATVAALGMISGPASIPALSPGGGASLSASGLDSASQVGHSAPSGGRWGTSAASWGGDASWSGGHAAAGIKEEIAALSDQLKRIAKQEDAALARLNEDRESAKSRGTLEDWTETYGAQYVEITNKASERSALILKRLQELNDRSAAV